MQRKFTIALEDLPEDARQRLADAVLNAPEAPVQERRKPANRALKLLAAVGILMILLVYGFGQPHHSGAIWFKPISVSALVAVLLAAAAGAQILGHLAEKANLRRFPVPRGLYVLPASVVDVQDDAVVVTPTIGITRVVTRGPSVHVELVGIDGAPAGFAFPLNGENNAGLRTMVAQQVQAAQLIAEGRHAEVAKLDPFYAFRAEGWPSAGSKAGRLPPLSPLLQHGALAGALLGAFVGVGLTSIRNLASDKVVFSRIEALGTSEAWRWYIDQGGRAREEAKQTHLPAAIAREDEAAFVAAKEEDTVAAWKIYLRDHSIHADEVKRAFLPEAELREAIAAGDLEAIRDIRARYSGPEHEDLRARAGAEIDRAYAAALDGFREQAPEKDRALMPFFEALLGWMKDHDTASVQVRFSPPSTEDLTATDEYVQKKMGARVDDCPIPPVAPHFSEALSAQRQAPILRSMKAGFDLIFPDNILNLVSPEEDEPGAVRPVIEVAYAIKSGTLYESEKGNRCFVGIRMDFAVALTVPDRPESYRFRFTVEPPETFNVEYQTTSYLIDSAPPDSLVYEVMVARAFETLAGRLQERFFREGSPAWELAVAASRPEEPAAPEGAALPPSAPVVPPSP